LKAVQDKGFPINVGVQFVFMAIWCLVYRLVAIQYECYIYSREIFNQVSNPIVCSGVFNKINFDFDSAMAGISK
jgi:hypothetical protein